MGTTLTGTTPQDTYDSLIKVTDNGPLSGTLKALSDGLGNDSTLSLSTTAASIAGTLAVTGTTTLTGALSGSSAALSGAFNINTTAGNFITLNDGAVAFGASLGLGSGGDFVLSSIASSVVTERFRITRSTGVVELAQGQIKFPATQVASADVNTLDDYEEGTFNFGIAFGGASVDLTYGVRGGTYTKIGRQVTVNGLVSLSNKGTSTGNVTITGLPFAIASGNPSYPSASISLFNVTYAGQYFAYGNEGSTAIPLEELSELGAVSALNDTNFANNSSLVVSLTYFV